MKPVSSKLLYGYMCQLIMDILPTTHHYHNSLLSLFKPFLCLLCNKLKILPGSDILMEISLASASKAFAKVSLYIISNEEFEKNTLTALYILTSIW